LRKKKGLKMFKRVVTAVCVSGLMLTVGPTSSVRAASIVNGTMCTKANSSKSVMVKGVNKVYLCVGNPSVVGVKPLTWTLKTCVSYWSAAQTSQDSIDQQRSLVKSMSDPDRTTYNKQLDDSQKQLDKVVAAIKANHCKAGL
jgi:hypothetical protein